jgi:2-polyprenyl-3-methyl-5-hydroxy-6-metoxy-1,4-benzoquinol methylase/predicted SAM-dependent methyltransferase
MSFEHSRPSRIYSAVVDPRGEFIYQAQRLVWSLTHFAGVDPENIFLHVAGESDFHIQKSLEQTGARIFGIQKHPSHLWCNKLQQLEHLSRVDCDNFVLLDCDMVVLEQPPLSDSILARTVDLPNPSLPVLEDIFEAAGLRFELAKTACSGEATVRGNANGGLYVIPQKYFPKMAIAWRRWADWCLARIELFAEYLIHVDQVSFALALAEEMLPFKELAIVYNFPTHLPLSSDFDCEPKILHYHKAVDSAQRLTAIPGLPIANAIIEKVNNSWNAHARNHFDNLAFWNSRYVLQPDLGSGLGSRGGILSHKQQLLSRVVVATGCNSILDVAGGDGVVLSALKDLVGVQALDISPEAKGHYLKNLPQAKWRQHDIRIAAPVEKADLTLCLDLLIHMPTLEDYSAAISNLCQCEGALLLSGFNFPPADTGPMTYFHEDIMGSLARMNRPGIPIGGYRELTLVWVPPVSPTNNPRDIQADTLEASIPFTCDWLLLSESLACAKKLLGFFPDQMSRCIEYPWVVNQLKDKAGLRILEVGAGVSPLPLMLASRGHKVLTVDSHGIERKLEDSKHWNEWGFLDYSKIDSRISSVNKCYEAGIARGEIDAFVSVSVIEHLPQKVRKKWLLDAHNDLANAGILLLTVDLMPFSNSIWNRSEGQIIEAEEEHGTLDDLLGDIQNAGFEVQKVESSSWLPKSRVGLAMVMASKITQINLDIGGQLNRNDMSGRWKIVDLHEGADYRLNLESEPLPISNETVANVYTSHCLEHLEPGKLRGVFAEIYRVMKSGGRFRMAVPHFMKGVDMYLNQPQKLNEPLMPRMNTNTPDTKMSRLSAWFYTETNPKNGTPGHKTAWDFELASRYLSEAGFREIRECTLSECHPVFAGKDNPGYEAFSLYVECIK